jgi:hypothetical protein
MQVFGVPSGMLAPHVREGVLQLMAADPEFVARLTAGS